MAQRTINSPGVEIRESDLSFTTPAPTGTSVYVTGFAQQGPIDEVLLITTKQELLQVYGPPTNAAEKYFHYTLTELLNSPATVYAGRLPYGRGAGDGFGSKYSALAYPVNAFTKALLLILLLYHLLKVYFQLQHQQHHIPTYQEALLLSI